VFVKGALWRARSDQDGLKVGDEIVVESVDGLTLTVAPAPQRPEGTAEGVQSAT
jgi:membrane protein implicated in regulation of membrane protease activity